MVGRHSNDECGIRTQGHGERVIWAASYQKMERDSRQEQTRTVAGGIALAMTIPTLCAISSDFTRQPLRIIPQAVAGLSICSAAAALRRCRRRRKRHIVASVRVISESVRALPAPSVVRPLIGIAFDATSAHSHACIGQQPLPYMDAAAPGACSESLLVAKRPTSIAHYPVLHKTLAALRSESSLAIANYWVLSLHPPLLLCPIFPRLAVSLIHSAPFRFYSALRRFRSLSPLALFLALRYVALVACGLGPIFPIDSLRTTIIPFDSRGLAAAAAPRDWCWSSSFRVSSCVHVHQRGVQQSKHTRRSGPGALPGSLSVAIKNESERAKDVVASQDLGLFKLSRARPGPSTKMAAGGAKPARARQRAKVELNDPDDERIRNRRSTSKGLRYTTIDYM
ncbi:hypothetical protein OE88DRAFT_1647805 [Heliocybe sulcata]|uniref:Uncharacterized protein n=1 Tax=Heliocybe sulcata TaxID=5364 RepID=A0A5C3MS66_9AGAM|nr:hypothetical protein OE88DRAFT_1647805 [Heliocybe sulcata]